MPSSNLMIGVGIVTDRPTTGAALAQVLSGDPELALVGRSTMPAAPVLLRNPALRVLLVNLSLRAHDTPPPGVRFIRQVKAQRPDVAVLSLKRYVDEDQFRAALDAGADACCFAAGPAARLRQAIKAIADGATWLEGPIAQTLFRGFHASEAKTPAPALSPRERETLRLLAEGYTNTQIADTIGCAYPTVRTHLTNLYRKLGVADRVSAAVYGLRHGLT